MEEKFVKPTHNIIDVMPYLKEIMGNGIIKDLQDNEVICPRCHGTGLAVRNNEYGLSGDPDKKAGMFPYKHQSISACPDCYNGVLRVCPHCGKHLTRHDYQCNCTGAEAERRSKEFDKEQALFDKSTKLSYDDPKTKKMNMLYSESFSYNNG